MHSKSWTKMAVEKYAWKIFAGSLKLLATIGEFCTNVKCLSLLLEQNSTCLPPSNNDSTLSIMCSNAMRYFLILDWQLKRSLRWQTLLQLIAQACWTIESLQIWLQALLISDRNKTTFLYVWKTVAILS